MRRQSPNWTLREHWRTFVVFMLLFAATYFAPYGWLQVVWLVLWAVAFNIVEGCGSTSSKEFARFLDISIKSTCELEYQLQLATDCDLLKRRVGGALCAETVEIRRMLCALRRKVLAAAGRSSSTDNHSPANNSKLSTQDLDPP